MTIGTLGSGLMSHPKLARAGSLGAERCLVALLLTGAPTGQGGGGSIPRR